MPGGVSKKMKNPFLRKALDIYFTRYNNGKKKLFRKENEEHAKAAESGEEKTGPIVFLGDSITDYYDLKKFYPDLNCVNRGISGNTTNDILNRMKVSVFDASPSMVIMLIGINDMMNEERRPGDVAADYERIVCYMADRLPGVPVILQSVYPGWDGDAEKAKKGPTMQVFPIAYLRDDIKALNSMIREIADEYGYVYADVYSRLATEEGLMNPEYSVDGCHPVEAGYKAVTEVLRPLIDELQAKDAAL